jgi:ABC-type nitrate/sulfonate/bicarbonate transport system permease component
MRILRPVRVAVSTGRLRSAGVDAAKGMAGLALAAAAWQGARALGLVDNRAIPGLVEALSAVVTDLTSGPLLRAAAETAHAWALGLGWATLLAVPAGLAIGRSSRLERLTRVVLELARPVPSVAFVPVAIIVLGIGVRMEVALIAFASFWPILLNTKAGAEAVDPVALETGRAFGLSDPQRFARIVLPSAVPSIATGIRVAASIALIVAITVEFVAGRAGIGVLLETARLSAAVDHVWGIVLLAGALGYLINVALLKIQAILLPWSVEHRRG